MLMAAGCVLVFDGIELPSGLVRQCPLFLLEQSIIAFAALLAACCAAICDGGDAEVSGVPVGW